MTSPGISVVIPLYNKRAFIERALASIATQRVQPNEVIVVDDGSTDGGAEIISRFTGLPIRLIRQKNSGVSAARNRGINEARYDWVAFLDADDEYFDSAMEDFQLARDRHPEVGLVFGHSARSDSLPKAEPLEKRYLAVPDYFAYLLTRGAHEAHTSSIMVRKSAIKAAGLFPDGVTIGEDTDTWMRLGCLYPFVRIDAPIAIYHLVDGDSGWKSVQGKEPYWFSTYETWRAAGRIPPARRRSAARYVEFCKLQAVIFNARAGRRAEAFRRLFLDVRWLKAPRVVLAKTLLISIFPVLSSPVAGEH